ncbi:ribonuclease III [Dehalobacterium formicoaceticum]|uniref:Ribonuclease 3 n=1 Tax=Dehalobacterium formicoaceticum TaxID=51515 RepID=A0ABT1Y021_9FIRM|nr:ribonuclease III [Dehalobacterium formicoaceticum]MCR6544200.1 ribonuclease III [Dehalobacterium formicoaceticum]
MDMNQVRQFAQKLAGMGINLTDLDLLKQALTHPTYAYEHKKQKLFHNQRLEFLGDAVLGLVMGEYLYQKFPQKPEGDLTKMRAAVVCAASLAEQAKNLDFGSYLLLGRGEDLSGGRERNSVLADAFEAVVGAIYLECGLEGARKFLIGSLAGTVERLEHDNMGDYKTMLQELVQKYDDEGVSYTILHESGPDHQKVFVAGVKYRDELLTQGQGNSKKEAEQKAAQAALETVDSWRHLITEKK